MEKNKIYRAEIIGYSGDGASIARIHDMVVFVPGGAVGDQCDIRIVKIAKHYAFGRIERVFIKSKHRIEPECPYAAKCGGCCYWHITYEEELRAKAKKVQDALQRIGGVSLEPEAVCGSESIYHYRNKAQYPVGSTMPIKFTHLPFNIIRYMVAILVTTIDILHSVSDRKSVV